MCSDIKPFTWEDKDAKKKRKAPRNAKSKAFSQLSCVLFRSSKLAGNPDLEQLVISLQPGQLVERLFIDEVQGN